MVDGSGRSRRDGCGALPDNHLPAEPPLAMAPRLIELCFQTAGLWEMAVGHRMGLPQHVDSVRLYRRAEEARGPLYAVVTPHAAGRASTRRWSMQPVCGTSR